MIEIIGIIASAIVLGSMIFNSTSIKRNMVMRVVNAIGSLIFIAYGVLINSISVIIMNSAMIIVCAIHFIILIKQYKKQKAKATVETIDVWINKSDDAKLACIKNGVLGIDWVGSHGWGRWEMILDSKGIPHINTECMDSHDDKSFSEAILKKLLEEAIIEE